MMTSHILIIDDSPLLQKIYRRMLKALPLSTSLVFAENGWEGLQRLRDPDLNIRLIFLDMHMPHMDGETFLNAAQRNSLLDDDTPIIVASSLPDETLSEMVRERMVGYLRKPFITEDIQAHIQRCLPEIGFSAASASSVGLRSLSPSR